MIITPLILTNPFHATWYHGTKASPFPEWHCPPPRRSPLEIPHSGLFFTEDLEFAKGAGDNVCTVKLNASTKVLTPAQGGSASKVLREAIIRSNPLAAHCEWLDNDSKWTDAWKTGEVMRFAYDIYDRKATTAIAKAVAAVATSLKRNVNIPVQDEVFTKQAILNLTRGWIEVMVVEGKKLGYQALHGAEIDQWANELAPPVARSWLAVMDKSVISAPTWL